MTRGPWVISKVSKAFGRDAQMHDSSLVGDLLIQKWKKFMELMEWVRPLKI